MLSNILTTLFVLTMALNVVALVRHYMMLRMMMITLNAFVAQQQQFHEVIKEMEGRDRRTNIAPD